MQKKVYISSTFEDLLKYRSALYSALRKMAYDVQAMEDYVARDDRLVHRCLADVAACDFYIGIFAQRYGWIPPEDNPSQLSITELECRRAREANKTCLLFLLDPKAAWPQMFTDSETGGGHAGADIQRLRTEFSNYSHGLFGTPEELVVNAMAALYLCEVEVPVDQQGKPPAQSTPAMAQIPRPPVVGFVARRDRQGRDILARLKDELTPERRQFVALWGAGGVGKTTLAAEAARAWVTQFGSRLA
ncbi:MAG TPA: DUF4062 domain-containing protein [Bryobacteraceae bacterium]